MPTSPVAVATLVALALAVVDWIAVARGSRAVERLAKPAVIVVLIGGMLVRGPGDAGGPAWALLLVALSASLVGDVLLLPPARFVAGLVAFLVAQVAYLVRFLMEPAEPAGIVLGLVLVAVVGLGVGRAILEGAARQRLALPVAVYLAAIMAMAVAASATALPAAAAGAWLFVASDAILGYDRFVRPGGPRLRVANLVTYHLAQVLLVIALAA